MLNTEPTILNVDDSPAGRYAVSRVLRQAGFQVEEAGSGFETLQMVASKPISLVVLDVNLPDLSGIEVCRRLKSDPNTSCLPILHLSATSVTSKSKVRGLESGADGYLTEPLDPEVLVATVRSMLRTRHAEEALRKSEAKFRRLAESNIIGITSGKGDRILEANSAFLQMLGYSPEDLANGQFSYIDITAPESAERDQRANQERLERGACTPYEKQYLRKDGSRIAALVGATTVDSPPDDTWIEFAVDLTERMRLEEQFRRAQKLESLGVMAGGIAHDFNNLLTGVMASSSLLLDKARPGSPDARLLETILEASHRMADLTQQMVAYSGKGRSVVRMFSVSEAILQIKELIESSAPPGVRLELTLQDDLPPIKADPEQVHQIIVNLVTNAFEAIQPETGHVRIRTGSMRIEAGEARRFASSGEVAPGNYVYIEVRDTGRGMDMQTQLKMFDPFFSTKFVGRGLGLAAVAGIVHSYKGAIHVESAPGRGAVVEVLLPVA